MRLKLFDEQFSSTCSTHLCLNISSPETPNLIHIPARFIYENDKSDNY